MTNGLHNTESATAFRLTKCQASELRLDLRDLDRFWAKVARQSNRECWAWTSNRTKDGYGQLSVGGKPEYAHRIAWTLSHGSIPLGLFVLHHCDHPFCVNPAHLFLGTHLDNMRDAAAKGRLSVPRPAARLLRPEQIAAMRAMRAAGAIYVDIGAAFGVSKAMAYKWARGPRGAALQVAS